VEDEEVENTGFRRTLAGMYVMTYLDRFWFEMMVSIMVRKDGLK
jgi:hypothetical protein